MKLPEKYVFQKKDELTISNDRPGGVFEHGFYATFMLLIRNTTTLQIYLSIEFGEI